MKKSAIITGGSRGIGLAVAEQLAKDGYSLVIMASGPFEKCEDNFNRCKELGAELIYVQGSISNGEDRVNCINTAIDQFGRIDVLVNNAGVAPAVRADLLDMSEESFDRLIDINLKGTMFMTQLVARQMTKQGVNPRKKGTIINISSVSSTAVSVNRGEYCISKAGISMLTKLFAARLAEEDIFVYEIRPGVIKTDMTAGVKEKYDTLFEGGAFPIKRWGLPEDIGNAVSVFCSDKLMYSTGIEICVDGGFHIQQL